MSNWFTHFARPNPAAPARLLCLPSSGGGSAVYRPWLDLLPQVELWAAVPPGRERRLGENAIGDLPELVNQLLPEVAALADRPWFLLGHSVGALVAFELTRALRDRGLPLPRRLFISAFRSPERLNRNPQMHHLSGDAFINALRGYGGTPEAILAHPEMMDLFGPTLRADFRLHETYQHQPAPPLPVPITCFAGNDDHVVPPGEMAGWDRHTSAEHEQHLFSGRHFFIHEAAEAVTRTLQARITADLRTAKPLNASVFG